MEKIEVTAKTFEADSARKAIRTNRLASAIMAASKHSARFTDVLIHEGEPVMVKSVTGLEPLTNFGVEESFVVERDDNKVFITGFSGIKVSSKQADEQAIDDYWNTEIEPDLKRIGSVDRTIKTPSGAFIRCSLFYFAEGMVSIVARITTAPRSLDTIGLPPDIVNRIKDGQKGILILTGPTACGKSSSAYSILDYFNRNVAGHITTIEQPIEYMMKSDKCRVTQRSVGRDLSNFSRGLETALRHSPDAILVGEVRDTETTETAILAGESGALVIITTHGRDISGALRKLCSMVSGSNSNAMLAVLAGSLIGVVRQSLIPYADGSGYTVVCDSIGSSPKVRNMIERSAWDELNTLQAGLRSMDHTSMNAQLIQLVKDKRVSKEDALARTSYRHGLLEAMR